MRRGPGHGDAARGAAPAARCPGKRHPTATARSTAARQNPPSILPQGGLGRYYMSYCLAVAQRFEPGAKVPDQIPEFLAIATTAAIAAIAQLLNTKASQQEVDVIQEALANADRYYRVLGTGPMTPGSAASPQEARRASVPATRPLLVDRSTRIGCWTVQPPALPPFILPLTPPCLPSFCR